MSDGFDRAPGAGRGRSRGLGRGGGGPEGGGFPSGAGPAVRPRQPLSPQPKAPGILQPPPLRQPRTAPPPGAQCEVPVGPQRPPRPGALPGTEPLSGTPSSWANAFPRPARCCLVRPSGFRKHSPKGRVVTGRGRARNGVWKVAAGILCAPCMGEGPSARSPSCAVPGGSKNCLRSPALRREQPPCLTHFLQKSQRGRKSISQAVMFTNELKQVFCSFFAGFLYIPWQ